MARLPLSRTERDIVATILAKRLRNQYMILFLSYLIDVLDSIKEPERPNIHSAERTLKQGIKNVNEFLNSDVSCIDQLRMDRHTFYVLCGLLRDEGGLKESKNMSIEERVAIFLNILAHDQKYRMILRRLKRSTETISRNFHQVLRAVLRLHTILMKTPEPVPQNSTDERWKWFKNCLGALDGTFIKVRVPEIDKPRYRTRKGELATNVLGACSIDMQFTYVLPGWEGSAADGRILRDAISRRNPLKVPRGYYYLVDAGYTNGDGFLAPFRGQRYHLNEWRDGHQPSSPEEFFNMKHSAARNVIERCFGLLKMRWAILRNSSFYDVDTHADIITACCLLHNLIRREMRQDPMEQELDFNIPVVENLNDEDSLISVVDTSNAWTCWRNSIAREMFDDWRLRRG